MLGVVVRHGAGAGAAGLVGGAGGRAATGLVLELLTSTGVAAGSREFPQRRAAGCERPTGSNRAGCGGRGTMISEKKQMNRSVLLAKEIVPKDDGAVSTRAPA